MKSGPFSIVVASALFGLTVCSDSPAPAPESPTILGIEELYRLDQLPRLKQVQVGSVSSYDRTGGNDDGFSGTHSFIRKEPDGLVIADLEGPGIIYRIATPTPTDDDIEFYFDGEAAPRIRRKVTELFDGTHTPFLSPLVGSGVGGNYSYVPITYQRSCKVVVKAEKFRFYQINYTRYPADTVIPTYEEPPSDAFVDQLNKAVALLRSVGSDISHSLVPEGTPIAKHTSRKTLRPGETVTLFDPIHTSSLQNATWTKKTETFEDTRVRFLSMKSTGDDIFGPHHISFICDMPASGTYKVGIKAVRGPGQGIVQMLQHDKRVGEAVNLYADRRSPSSILPLGTREMTAGDTTSSSIWSTRTHVRPGWVSIWWRSSSNGLSSS